jgi:hypothetical protein
MATLTDGSTVASAATVEQQVPALIRQFIDYPVTENFRRRELCANAAARRLVLDKHCPRVLSCAGCGESIDFVGT